MMNELEPYIGELKNKKKIKDIEKKILYQELEIDKLESERLVIEKCVEETVKNLRKLKNRFHRYKDNEKLIEEIEEAEDKIKKGQKALKGMNYLLSRKEVSLVRLKQKRREQIRKGLEEHLNKLKLIHKNKDGNLEDLDKIRREIEHLSLLIKEQ